MENELRTCVVHAGRCQTGYWGAALGVHEATSSLDGTRCRFLHPAAFWAQSLTFHSCFPDLGSFEIFRSRSVTCVGRQEDLIINPLSAGALLNLVESSWACLLRMPFDYIDGTLRGTYLYCRYFPLCSCYRHRTIHNTILDSAYNPMPSGYRARLHRPVSTRVSLISNNVLISASIYPVITITIIDTGFLIATLFCTDDLNSNGLRIKSLIVRPRWVLPSEGVLSAFYALKSHATEISTNLSVFSTTMIEYGG